MAQPIPVVPFVTYIEYAPRAQTPIDASPRFRSIIERPGAEGRHAPDL